MEKIVQVRDTISVFTRAKYPILAVETFEEKRVTKLLSQLAQDQGRELYCWTITQGLIDRKENPVGQSKGNPLAVLDEILHMQNEAIFLLKDFHRYMEEPTIVRYFRDLHSKLKDQRKTIVLLSPKVAIPHDLQKSITLVDFPLPEYSELEEILVESVEQLRRKTDDLELRYGDSEDEDEQGAIKEECERLTEIYSTLTSQLDERKDKLVQALAGLTFDEAENVVAMCIVKHDLNIATINAEKKQIIRKSGTLEYYEASEGMGEIGGLDELKKWTKKAAKRFSQEAKDYGLEPPRGILLIGPPGTGKSLSAKAIANALQVPLLQFDIGAAASSLYGQTTQNAIGAFKLAEAVSPCVLWIDEIEKGMASGQGGNDSGHEETSRMRGAMLTRWEETQAAVFKIGTSNSPFNLAPEIMQRFEVIFFVDAPQHNERKEIFAAKLREVNRNPKDFDLNALAQATDNFVGREIRTIVREALATAFYEDGRELETRDMIYIASKMTPMLIQKKEDIDALREWAKSNAIPASAPESRKVSRGREVEV